MPPKNLTALGAVVLTLSLGVSASTPQAVIFVDDDAPLGGDGTTWPTAYMYLQDALAIATDGDEIRVAAGTYTPGRDEGGNITPGDREAAFQLITGVAIRGGYRGCRDGDCNSDPGERSVHVYSTILSGDLGGDDKGQPIACATHEECEAEYGDGFPCDTGGTGRCIYDLTSENCYHVVTANGVDRTAVLDGVTISAGNANGEFIPHDAGGGMRNELASPTLVACTFTENYAVWGGGIENFNHSDPTLSGCRFTGNVAQLGGGVNNNNSDPSLTSCEFTENRAFGPGGGMYNQRGSNPTLVDCAFVENSAAFGGGMNNACGGNPVMEGCVFARNVAYAGGGMTNEFGSDPLMVGCAFIGNSAAEGGGMSSRDNSSPTVVNTIFAENTADRGGGLYFDGSEHAVLTNCTVTMNSAIMGGALACNSYEQTRPSTVTVTDSILWNGGHEVWSEDGSSIEITYSDIQDEQPNDGIVYPGVRNVDANPLFLPGPAGCYYLSQAAAGQEANSPCLDTGSDTAESLELDTLTTRSDEGTDTEIADMGYHYPVTGKPLIVGDFDRSGVLDLADVAELQKCFKGSSGGGGDVSVSPCCRIFDFEPDGDVDLQDYAAFRLAFSP